MLQKAQKAHDKAIAKSYEQLRNLLFGNAQSQWDSICRKMHERDLWAAVNGHLTKSRRPRMWTYFLDCLELYELTVFSADAADRQRFYIKQAVLTLQRATVRQHISRMGVLNDCVKHLPTVKGSSKAVPTTKKVNIPFGEADPAAIVLTSVPMSWQNQYNLNHSMVPESTRTLLPDLEAIEQVMVEKKGANLKAKGKGSTAPSEAKGNQKRKASGGPNGQVPKKGCSEKFCQCFKAHVGPFTTHNTLDCHCYDSNGKPLAAAARKPSESKKPYKKSGGDKGMAFMQSMFEAYEKSQKKAGKSKKRKKRDYVSSDSSDSEYETGYSNTELDVDKRFKIDGPLGTIYSSHKPHLIKVADTALSETMKADQIAIETATTGRVTAVVAVMRIFSRKRCQLRSANLGNEKPSCQKAESADFPKGNTRGLRSPSQKSRKDQIPKKLAYKSKKLELNSTNFKKTCSDRAKMPDPSVSSGLYVKNKTIRVLLDSESSGDLLFIKKNPVNEFPL
jgi:hypothetical protein